jgi:hypothetical protein
MNDFVEAARAKGAQVLWAPSDVTSFYANYTERKWVTSLPHQKLPPSAKRTPPPMPLSTTTNGGCDVDSPQGSPWTRQIATLEIGRGDGILSSTNGMAQQELCVSHLPNPTPNGHTAAQTAVTRWPAGP